MIWEVDGEGPCLNKAGRAIRRKRKTVSKVIKYSKE